jgi:hypothetical protein
MRLGRFRESTSCPLVLGVDLRFLRGVRMAAPTTMPILHHPLLNSRFTVHVSGIEHWANPRI